MIAIGTRRGGFAWLVGHEMRLSWRSRTRGMPALAGFYLLAVYLLIGITVAANLTSWQLSWSPVAGAVIFLASIAVFTLMIAQAMLASQRTLYEARDLDLLLTSPMPEQRVLSAKLVSIAAGVSLTYASLLLPLVVPFAVLGHPQLLGVVGLLVAVPLAAAALGLALTLLLARTVGPRVSRTVGQILAALLASGFYLASQLMNAFHKRGLDGGLLGWARRHELGVAGPTAWPGHAAFGSIQALLYILTPSALLFVTVGMLFHSTFLTGYQDAGMRLAGARPRKGGGERLFHASLRRAVFVKEWRLLARDPALAFQMVLRLVYLVPLLLLGFRNGSSHSLAPILAFASVLITSQLCGSLAWLTIWAEDAPELLVTAPVAKDVIDQAKLSAALTMTVPLALILPVGMLALTPPGAGVTLLATAIAAWCCGLIELHLGKPGERAKFARRGQGSLAATLLALFVASIFGGMAAIVTWLLA